jgi:hypothetical protein
MNKDIKTVCEICAKEKLTPSNSIIIDIERTGHCFVFCKNCILRKTKLVNDHIRKHLEQEYHLHTYFHR